MSNRYQALGVSADKQEVHNAIRNLDPGLYPRAFCKILPDYAAGDENFVNLLHADTAGTKTSLAYLYWKETGDVSVWKGIAQDALVMNVDDLACVGCTGDILISSTIGRNKHLIPGTVIEEVISGTQSFIQRMAELGIKMISGGGETADVGDIVRTIDVGITAFARMAKKDLVINSISKGDVIIGLASFGKASYESEYNSGIGSNGLTAARHDLLNKNYQQIEASFAPETDKQHVYTGQFGLRDSWEYNGNKYEIGQLLLSPTRTYLPVLSVLLKECRSSIKGIIHCTGGAQTKVKKFVENCRIIKDNLFELPPIFKLLSQYSLCSAQELYQVYNMGHRMELYVHPEHSSKIIEIANSFNIEAREIGRVESSNKTEVIVKSSLGEFIY